MYTYTLYTAFLSRFTEKYWTLVLLKFYSFHFDIIFDEFVHIGYNCGLLYIQNYKGCTNVTETQNRNIS